MPNSKRRVLLIGWDAADWEHITPLLEAGLLPTLDAFINEGVMGNLATLQPILSPMLWNSIATGKHAYKHGIHGFVEPDYDHGGARPYSSYSRKVRALWNIFSSQGIRSNVINWWASHPAEPINGCIVTNAFNGITLDPKKGFVASRGTVHPIEKTNFYSQFKVFPNELTKEHLLPFAPLAAEIDQDEDSRVQTLATVIAETATTQAVATAVMELEPWDFMAVYFTGIDHFSHAFMQYHPPRLPYVPEKDFEIFKDVVVGAYRFHDMILERLLHLAGPETTVILCSDHGFQSRELRPFGTPREPAGPAIWHRRFGVFVAKGPGIKKDERVYGASLVDIAPTILTLFDLPIGEDMDGRPLIEIFEEPPEIRRIPSWEDVPGEFGMHKEQVKLDKSEADELMRQFVALGYVDDPGDDREKQAVSAEIEAKYNLARNYQWRQMQDDAIPIFEEIVRRFPWETRFIDHLALSYHLAGYLRQTIRLLESAFDIARTNDAMAQLTWANAKIDLGELDEGLEMLLKLEKRERAAAPVLYNKIGDVYRKLGRPIDAERAYRRATGIHPDNAEAYMGLSTVYRRRGMNQETIDAALQAVGLVYRLPVAHLNLGIALARSGEPERAAFALTTALKFNPNLSSAHRWLEVIHRTMLGDEANARYHRAEGQRVGICAASEKRDFAARRDTLFDIPPFPSEKERDEQLKKERPNRVDPRKKSGKTFVLVSGLPRSGTSLMMQMLEAGGLPAKTDGERTADADNPRGYYEWEAIKKVPSDPSILDEPNLTSKVIKVVTMLLQKMPYSHEYKVIFMTRPVSEVVASQTKMIERRGSEGAKADSSALEQELESHRNAVVRWMKSNPRVEFIEIEYPSLIASPEDAVAKVAEFLGPERLPHPENMRSAIDASLYRQRREAP